MACFPIDRAEQLRIEKMLLIKADKDIEDGERRLRNQQQLLSDLRAAGHDATQAERLVSLLQQTLIEWERHRVLIEDRVNYLERTAVPS
ncbi:MAG TPA: hypothetical protein VFL62_14875 [Bradyrhizobium sp.]|uniref:hypothetical protein n=1 Tax=Bradyrhizobium sp. TaxID=376 RepID=UPI002D80879D|nr:hypothetical protein [Bradyrhizobium sp.]HET7887504.1 hypothetical protein [Bradyrhizobium sp.]